VDLLLILANEDLKDQCHNADERIVRAQAMAKEFNPTFIQASALIEAACETEPIKTINR
jgi:hypothetical protein